MSTNPYVSNIIQQTGMTEREVHQSTSPTKRTFPCTIHGRYFSCQADYDWEVAEFLNGNWHIARQIPGFYFYVIICFH